MVKIKGKPEIILLLFANNPAISIELVQKGIKKLTEDDAFDSAFSVSKYNMFSPTRAKKLVGNIIEPFYDLNENDNITSIRDSQGDVYFADMSVSVVRSKCLENLDRGLLPQKWMGKKIRAITSSAGCDVDYEWQIPSVEYWIKKNSKK